MKKNTGLALILLASSLIIIGGSCKTETPKTQEPEQESPPQNEIIKKQTTLLINFGDEVNQKEFNLEFSGEKTVYDLLGELASQNKVEMEVKESDFGIFLESIDGIEGGQDDKYWLYYVNDQMAPVGIAEQKVEDGDKIEFKFEKNPF